MFQIGPVGRIDVKEVILADIHGKAVTFALNNGMALLDGDPAPVKGITEADLDNFQEELDKIPDGADAGHVALINAVRAAFIAKLLSHAVGDDCVDELSHILGHVHDNVIRYLES